MDNLKVLFQKLKSLYANNNFDTTDYLLKSTANRTRLLKSIEDYQNGLGQERSLIEAETSQ